MSNDWFGSDDSSFQTGNASDFGFDGGGATPPPVQYKKGGWHVGLTLLALVLCAGLSFLMAYLTRDISRRGAILLGATFALPALAVMLATLLVEAATASMVPRYSQKGQLGVSLVCVLCCFIVGCFGETVNGFVKPVTTTQKTGGYMVLMDKSGSMDWYDRDLESVAAVEKFMGELPDGSYMGVITFESKLMGQSGFGTLTPEKRAENLKVIRQLTGGGTEFFKPITKALDLLEQPGPVPQGMDVLVLMVTDADLVTDDISSAELSTLKNRFAQHPNFHFSCLLIGKDLQPNMKALVTATGGEVFTIDNVANIHQDIVTASAIVARPVEATDVIRDAGQTQGVNGMSLAMMVLEGLIIGVALLLMTSRQGQWRFQTVLSVLMGIAAGVILNMVNLGSVWLQEAVAFSCYGVVFMTKNK